MEGFNPGNECALCKGRCCKERGCALSPDDIKWLKSPISTDEMLSFLKAEDNKYAIDQTYFDGANFYYMRMRTKCYTFIGLEGFGECSELSDKGCNLDFDDRPKGGRFLKSSPDMNCREEYGVEQMVLDWRPYQEQLMEIWNTYSQKFESDGTMDKCDREYYEYMKAKRQASTT